MKVVCVGHSTYDTTLPMDFYPTENIKYRIPKHIECGGGPASNGAYLLAKWGMNTTMLSVVGKDYYGDQIIKEFQSIGASTEYIEQKEGHGTSSSYIIANRSNVTVVRRCWPSIIWNSILLPSGTTCETMLPKK